VLVAWAGVVAIGTIPFSIVASRRLKIAMLNLANLRFKGSTPGSSITSLISATHFAASTKSDLTVPTSTPALAGNEWGG
jgi:hypothetical protein